MDTRHIPRNFDIADETTPFVSNCWYIAARSAEVGQALMDRMILEQSVLLYRQTDGTPVAIQNRCPHRSAPLSMGRRVGDSVVCGYHGLRFAPTGSCENIPQQKAIPKKCGLQSYPLVERGPFLWIWMGTTELADPTKIPCPDWFKSTDIAVVEGYFHVRTNYLHLHENVLDLSHVPYLHGTHNATEQFAEREPEVNVNGYVISARRSEYDRPPPPHFAASIGFSEDRIVNRHTDGAFESPAIHLAQTRIEDTQSDVGQRKDFFFFIAHAFTPETQTTTHYFWANGRDTSVGNAAINEIVRQRSTKVYTEDIDILEATEKIRKNEQRDGFQEISIVTDKAGIQMRKIVARLAAQEQA